MFGPPDIAPADDPWVSALALLGRGASDLGIELGAEQEEQLARYCRLLAAANTSMNLTALRSPDEMMRGLILDSLALSAAVQRVCEAPEAGATVIDVGSGAGIPGIPLAIVHRAWRAVLVESIRKKAVFLESARSLLSPDRITVLHGRAEQLSREPRWRDGADLCVARAVAPLPTVIELCAPFVRPGGWMAFPKGGRTAMEVESAAAAARSLRVELVEIIPVPASLGVGVERATIVYRKRAPTPQEYPRRTGMAKSKPIRG